MSLRASASTWPAALSWRRPGLRRPRAPPRPRWSNASSRHRSATCPVGSAVDCSCARADRPVPTSDRVLRAAWTAVLLRAATRCGAAFARFGFVAHLQRIGLGRQSQFFRLDFGFFNDARAFTLQIVPGAFNCARVLRLPIRIPTAAPAATPMSSPTTKNSTPSIVTPLMCRKNNSPQIPHRYAPRATPPPLPHAPLHS